MGRGALAAGLARRGVAVTPAAPWFAWLPIALAALAAAPWVVAVFRARINDDALVRAVRKLLDAGNADRVVKLTRAAPASPLCAAIRAGVEGCREGVRQGDPAAGYRSAGDLSSAVILAPVRSRFDEAFATAARPVRSARVAAPPAALVLLATSAWSLLHAPGDLAPVGAAAACLAVLALTGRADRRLHAGRGRAFEALGGSFDALLRDPQRRPAAMASATTGVRVSFEVREPDLEPWVAACDEDVIRIGTDQRCEVVLGAPRVARMHAVIEASDERLTIIDLGSEGRTRINGEVVNKRALSDGDVITLGEAELLVRRQ